MFLNIMLQVEAAVMISQHEQEEVAVNTAHRDSTRISRHEQEVLLIQRTGIRVHN